MAATDRRPLVAGNWKMNGLKSSVPELGRIVQGAADPIGGGFVNTSKHETVSCCLGERPRSKAIWAEYRARCTAPQLAPTPLARLPALC